MLPVTEISIDDVLSDSEFNSRGHVVPFDVTELSNSIRRDGLLSPITVQPWDKDGKKYRVVCGHRRILACQLLEWKNIPAFVRADLNDQSALVLNVQENINRSELNILQEAHAVDRFVKMGWDTKTIAERLDVSQPWVYTRLKLLELPLEIQEKAAAGLLTQYQIKEIAALPTRNLQFEAVRKAIDHKLTGEKKALKITKKDPGLHKKKVRVIAEIHKMQDHIRAALGNNLATKVLGWVGGYLTTYEFFLEVEKEAAKQGKMYVIPTSLDEVEAA